MKFKYYVAGWGWAYVDIEIDDFKPKFHYADAFCGGLRILLEQILEVLNIGKGFSMHPFDYSDETNKINWTIDEEGATVEFDFVVNAAKDKALLKIIHHLPGLEKDECEYEDEINFNEFIAEIVKSCDEILKKYGIIGYFANSLMAQDFPMTYYLLLKDYLHKRINNLDIVYEKLPKDSEGEESYLYKTDINTEIALINIAV
jgi:hypothetical protein